MDKTKQRIAIAEACGWANIDWCPMDDTAWGELSGNLCGLLGGKIRLVPDYLNDLNAMREAEKLLTEEQWYDWFDIIGHVIGYKTPIPPMDYTELVLIQKATAAQRAEAFLRTLGLWEETA